MNNNSPLVNLSLLESLKGEKKTDEIGLYIPFLADILNEINEENVNIEALQNTFFHDKELLVYGGFVVLFVIAFYESIKYGKAIYKNIYKVSKKKLNNLFL